MPNNNAEVNSSRLLNLNKVEVITRKAYNQMMNWILTLLNGLQQSKAL